MKGYVYVLTNEAMPGLVKIGRSKHAAGVRAKAMYSGDTGVPLPFEVYFECLFDDCVEAEALIHSALDDERINPNREFFKLTPDEATQSLLAARAGDCGHVVVESEMHIDQVDVHLLAQNLDRHPFVVVEALSRIQADELAPALERYDEQVRQYKERSTVAFSVVEGGEG